MPNQIGRFKVANYCSDMSLKPFVIRINIPGMDSDEMASCSIEYGQGYDTWVLCTPPTDTLEIQCQCDPCDRNGVLQEFLRLGIIHRISMELERYDRVHGINYDVWIAYTTWLSSLMVYLQDVNTSAIYVNPLFMNKGSVPRQLGELYRHVYPTVDLDTAVTGRALEAYTALNLHNIADVAKRKSVEHLKTWELSEWLLDNHFAYDMENVQFYRVGT